MLLPQYTLRWMLAVTALCAAVFSIAGLAVRGHTWALGVSVGVLSLAVAMLVYAAMFLIAWSFATVLAARPGSGGSTGRSPFRSEAPVAATLVDEDDASAIPLLLDEERT